MAQLLTVAELNGLYPEAANLPAAAVTKYLAQANAYAIGFIGGVPPMDDEDVSTTVKAAVATAFEVLSEGQTSQTDPTNGNITEYAPESPYARREPNPMKVVDVMLGQAKAAYERSQGNEEAGGLFWLGRC